MTTISSSDLATVAGGVKVKIHSGAWFNNLLVTAGNAVSATAARQRAMQPKRSTNPFFEHGGIAGPIGSPTP